MKIIMEELANSNAAEQVKVDPDIENYKRVITLNSDQLIAQIKMLDNNGNWRFVNKKKNLLQKAIKDIRNLIRWIKRS